MAAINPAAMALLRRVSHIPGYSTFSTVRYLSSTIPRPTTREKLASVRDIFKLSPRGQSPQHGPSSLGSLSSNLNASYAPPPAIETRLPKMGPTAGRSVVVQSGLPQAFLKLEHVLKDNQVKTMVRLAREHERPGLKRKRLKSQRYRKRFKEGFKRMVQVALKMKKLGM